MKLPATSALATCIFAASFAAEAAADQPTDTVFELRQYTLHPGQRDTLVDVFDDQFVEGQEAVGIRIIGQYRDLDDPDRFVWLRSFSDMESRKDALTKLYTGPVWKAHGRLAAGTMVDSDNVLLLRPLRPQTVFAPSTVKLPPPGTRGPGKGLLLANIVYVEKNTPAEFGEFFEKELRPHWEQAGASVIAANGERSQPQHLSVPAGARARERIRLVRAVPGPGSCRQAAARTRAVDAMARSGRKVERVDASQDRGPASAADRTLAIAAELGYRGDACCGYSSCMATT